MSDTKVLTNNEICLGIDVVMNAMTSSDARQFLQDLITTINAKDDQRRKTEDAWRQKYDELQARQTVEMEALRGVVRGTHIRIYDIFPLRYYCDSCTQRDAGKDIPPEDWLRWTQTWLWAPGKPEKHKPGCLAARKEATMRALKYEYPKILDPQRAPFYEARRLEIAEARKGSGE